MVKNHKNIGRKKNLKSHISKPHTWSKLKIENLRDFSERLLLMNFHKVQMKLVHI